MSYLEARQYFLERATSSQQSIPNHPCKIGNGECCVRTATIEEEDTEIIARAAAQGLIDPDTIEEAIRNAQDHKRIACPFLSKKRTCMINDVKPVVCISTGNGGGFDEDSMKDQEVRSACTTFEEKFKADDPTSEQVSVPVNKLRNTMCRGCNKTLNDRETRIPVFDAMLYSLYFNMVDQIRPVDMGEWVEYRLRSQIASYKK